MGDHDQNRQIPFDTCWDILSRLPVKSLVRFMSVSKQWLSMISSDPYFIQNHLFCANQNPDFKHTMRTVYSSYKILKKILFSDPCFIQNHLFCANQNPDFKHTMLVGYSSYKILDHHQNLITLAFVYSPPPTSRKHDRNDTKVEILASYNGLLLLGIGQKDHFLWNPSTRSYKKIPCNFDHQRDFFRMYGLAFESSSNTYKVIRIVRGLSNPSYARTPNPYYPHYDSTTVKVYTSRTNSWRKIAYFPYKPFVNKQGLLVNGAPHWIVTRAESEEYVIIYFDLVEEKFKELGNPSWLVFDSAFCLGVFNGFLSLLRKDGREVWVVKEHGVKESWTKLITKDKSMLFETNYAVRISPDEKHRTAFGEVEYVESLVSPHITEREAAA